MADQYSIKYKDHNINHCTLAIQEAKLSIDRLAVPNSVRIFKIDNGNVGISFSITIPLPSRGTVNGIDIQETEPVFLIINPKTYPYKAPLAFSDRKDFPSEKLPHLNPVPKGFPPNFCLHRGNINEWFIEHTIEDFVIRLKNWLRDAARNRLIKIKNKDEFEVSRITESFGYNIFSPDDLFDLITYREEDQDKYYKYLWYEIVKDDPLIDTKKAYFSIKFSLKISNDNAEDVIKLTKEINNLNDNKNSLNKRNIGVFLYPPNDFISTTYFSTFPSNYQDFEIWCISLNLNIKEAIQEYLSKGYQCLGGIPISIAIRRPQNIINTHSSIEILNFVIGAGGDLWPKNNQINVESKVYILENRKPIDINFAKELSNQTNDIFKDKSVFIGCGAVGSKLIMHLAKTGLTNYEIIDNDKLSPHNLIRHALLSKSIGKNKAEAIKTEIEEIFYSDKSNLKIESINEKGEEYLNKLTNTKLKKIEAIIDTTASNSFQMYISDYDLPSNVRCIRAEIAYDGKLGILKIEGNRRSPRLDDLNLFLLDYSNENSFISSWLRDFDNKRNLGDFEFEEINIGVSCNSNTLKLSDDIISLHSSYFSYAIKNSNQSETGEIHLSMFQPDVNIPIRVEKIVIGNVLEIRFKNNNLWKVRIREDLVAKIIKELEENSPNETGGLLLGKVDVKRKIIYVTRVLPAPTDSIKKPYYFVRGTKNVPEIINECRTMSGNLIDYVGEWHTHPNGSSKPSETDFSAVKELRTALDKIPYPTFILIATNTKVNPYIFGPKTLIY